MKALMTVGQVLTMSSIELLELVNQSRANHGETIVRHNDFLARCKDELDGEPYEIFVESAKGRTPAFEAIRMTIDQCKLVGMRESKGVRRWVLDRLNELEARQQSVVPDLSTDVGKLLLIQDLTAKQLALIESNKQLQAERDEAKRTKAEIGSRREATAMATAAAKSKEVERLKHELGRNQQHATVVAVEKATGRKFAKNAYVALRRVTKKYGLEAVSVMDPRWGTTKAWPAIAWREAFGIDLSDLFPGAEAA